jgi:hypothetical protein
VGCGAANLDVGSVGFENPRHRILAAPVIIVVVIVVPVAHPLVVLTVSHVLPFYQPWFVAVAIRTLAVNIRAVAVDAARWMRAEPSKASYRFCSTSRSTKTRSPTACGLICPLAEPDHSACQNKPGFLA